MKRASLISIPKFANANYIAIFDKGKGNIYNANNTKITVTRATILQGWCCNQTKLWRILLIIHIENNNTKTFFATPYQWSSFPSDLPQPRL